MHGQQVKRRNSTRMERDFIQGGVGLLEPHLEEVTYAATPVLANRRSPERAGSPREAWIRWLAPHFPKGSAYFTGTYGDEYGLPNGLMLARNVHHDFRRFLVERGLTDREFINGVEQHKYRDGNVLHCHAIIGGDFSDLDRRLLKAEWQADRGFCRVLPVLDGCASYVTKYALKGDTEHFDWNLA